MKYLNDSVAVAFTGSMTWLTYMLGGWDDALKILFFCVILDIASGIVKGFYYKDFTSRRLRMGFSTKIGYFIVIALANMLDGALPDSEPVLRTIAVWFYIYVEASSIIENMAQVGVPVPKAIADRLGVMNKENQRYVPEVVKQKPEAPELEVVKGGAEETAPKESRESSSEEAK